MHEVTATVDARDGHDRHLRYLEGLGAAVFLLYALAQAAQEVVLARAPAGGGLAEQFAFAVSNADRFRAIFLYVGFLGMPLAYAAVYRRLRASGWALAGLVWIGLFLALELTNRGIELVTLAKWQRQWLALPDSDPQRAVLAGRIEVAESVQFGTYLPLLAVYALASLAFAIALRGTDRWSKLAKAGFALNFVRALARFGAMQLGITALGPLADAIYLPLTLIHAVAVGLWLAVPRAPEAAR